MTLKQILDELWSDPLVRCPKHITRWIGWLDAEERTPNHLTKIENTGDIDLFYAPGRRVDLEKK
jgi:hypothetical protein